MLKIDWIVAECLKEGIQVDYYTVEEILSGSGKWDYALEDLVSLLEVEWLELS